MTLTNYCEKYVPLVLLRNMNELVMDDAARLERYEFEYHQQ